MTRPTGSHVADFNQSKRQVRRIFVLGVIITAVLALLILGVIVLSPTKPGTASAPLFLLIIPVASAIWIVITGLNAFKHPRKLEIYADGFILRDLKSNDALDEALWTEVSDITIFDKKKARSGAYADAGEQAFGFIGRLVVSSIADGSGGTPDRNLFICLPKKKIMFDNSYSNPTPPDETLFSVTREIWFDQAVHALDVGENIAFGKVELTPEGVKSGKDMAVWSAITEAKYVNEAGTVGIWWNNPSKRSAQVMNAPLGYRGEALIQVINQKTGRKTTSLVSKLGKL